MKSVVYFNKNHRKEFWLNNKDVLTMISLNTFKANVGGGGGNLFFSEKHSNRNLHCDTVIELLYFDMKILLLSKPETCQSVRQLLWLYGNQYHFPAFPLHCICLLSYATYIINSLGHELAFYCLYRSQARIEWLLIWSSRHGYTFFLSAPVGSVLSQRMIWILQDWLRTSI